MRAPDVQLRVPSRGSNSVGLPTGVSAQACAVSEAVLGWDRAQGSGIWEAASRAGGGEAVAGVGMRRGSQDSLSPQRGPPHSLRPPRQPPHHVF